MSLDCVSIVLDCLHEFSLLNVHGFHSETALFLLQLVVHDLFEAHALETEHRVEALVVPLVGQDVVRVPAVVIDVQLMEDHVGGSAHFEGEVDCDVLESQVARQGGIG